jgi:hypothetical protein
LGFRAAEGNSARLVIPEATPEVMRIEIQKVTGSAAYDIQLNQPRIAVKGGTRYQLGFQSRGEQPRTLCAGVSLAHPPWSGVGCYRSFRLTPEWQDFVEEFVSTADDENARIHFDAAESAVTVELRGVYLVDADSNKPIEPSCPAAAPDTSPDAAPAVGKVNFGDFRRVLPIGENWGFERGTPIDRYYIREFLAKRPVRFRGVY